MSDLTGRVFDRLTALRLVEPPKPPRYVTLYLCRCVCGNECRVAKANLLSGNTRSCGCFRNEQQRASRLMHGLSRTTEYGAYRCMWNGCYNVDSNRYKYLGAYGIGICERWKTSLHAFLTDMGPRPAGARLYRLDRTADFSPTNCMWLQRGATP